MSEPRPFRPANSSDGMDFEERFCDRCALDASGECLIHNLAVLGDEPKEWIYGEDGKPTCTSYQPENEGENS